MGTNADSATHRVAAIGELFGDAARASILVALLDGRARTAGELALAGNISAQSASGHLAKLTAGGLLAVRSQGRHRYYELANAEVAHALEAAGSLDARRTNGAVNEGRRTEGAVHSRLANSDIRMARSCYDHLAGVVAVDLTERMESSGAIRACGEWEYELGRNGENIFGKIGVELDGISSRAARVRSPLPRLDRTQAAFSRRARCSFVRAIGRGGLGGEEEGFARSEDHASRRTQDWGARTEIKRARLLPRPSQLVDDCGRAYCGVAAFM